MNTSLISAFCAMAIVSARAQSVNDLVDPFGGCGGTTSAPSEGMARGWNWEKAQTGNTFPGAIRPFGLVSVCGFTGGKLVFRLVDRPVTPSPIPDWL